MPPILIAGTDIDFPHDPPYGTQKVLMGKVVAACDRRAHALLEAPTGSGKTLALLCAALAWQARLKAEGCVVCMRERGEWVMRERRTRDACARRRARCASNLTPLSFPSV